MCAARAHESAPAGAKMAKKEVGFSEERSPSRTPPSAGKLSCVFPSLSAPAPAGAVTCRAAAAGGGGARVVVGEAHGACADRVLDGPASGLGPHRAGGRRHEARGRGLLRTPLRAG